jgi:hypothetical protein
MKAVVYRSFGGPEVLEYTNVPDPKLSQNNVLVRVRAAALNPADHLLQAGLGESYTDAWFPVHPRLGYRWRRRARGRWGQRIRARGRSDRLYPSGYPPSRRLR